MTHPNCKHTVSGHVSDYAIACGEGGLFCSTECAREAHTAYAWQTLRLFLLLIGGLAALKGCT